MKLSLQVIIGAPSLALSAHLIYVYGVALAPVAFFPFILGSFALFDLVEQRQKEQDKR
jgi:hypothetical protein